ncbi:MAG: glycosyltransferase family 2 protein [Methanomassiliicoccales archaeon]
MSPAYIALLSILSIFSVGLLLIEGLRIGQRRKESFDIRTPSMRVLVIVPCRGIDLTLQENLESLMHQSYTNYEIVAVVDDSSDPALEVIGRVGMRWTVSSVSCGNCSGKVRAIATALQSFPSFDAYVIADSDGTYERDWLYEILLPLSDPECGLSTTFPLFEARGGFWSRIKMLWGFVGQSMMDSPITRFGWGGSLAFRRSLLEDGGISEFSESVSDDGALTHICHRKKLRIAYCGKTIVRVRSRENFQSFIEWSNRQTALAIAGNALLFPIGVAYFSVRILLFIGSIVLAALLSPFVLLLLIPFALIIARIYYRLKVRNPLYVFLFFLNDFIYLSNLLKGGRMKTITWRGRVYSLR